MIEVQCPSCQTRYRIEERVLPQDNPTFKCSRCGHVFSGDPRLTKRGGAASKPRPTPPPAAKAPAVPQDASAAPAQAPPPQAPPPQTQTQAQPRSGPPPRPTSVRTDVVPSPAPQSPAADVHAAAPAPAQPPRRAPSAELPNGFQRPPQPRPASTTPAASANDAPMRPPAPPPRPAASGRGPRDSDGETDNPLARSFADEESKTPENLTFDFGDDPADQHHLDETAEPSEPEDRYDRWRVGDPDAEPPAEELTHEMARYRARRAAIMQASQRVDRASAAAEAPEHDRLHSSGFFLGLFALIVIGFAVFTFMLGLSPSFSRELLAQVPVIGGNFTPVAPRPAAVALSEVHAEYRLLDSSRRALIVSGRAENRGAEPLHTIEVGVSLVDNQRRPVTSQSVFCGDLVSPKIVSQMTPHELQFFQKLAPPKNFALKSGDSSPFFVMFINPPPNVANYQVSVIKVEPAAGESMAEAGI
jgi:predicted Zn finger-like uncharacterized protein